MHLSYLNNEMVVKNSDSVYDYYRMIAMISLILFRPLSIKEQPING